MVLESGNFQTDFYNFSRKFVFCEILELNRNSVIIRKGFTTSVLCFFFTAKVQCYKINFFLLLKFGSCEVTGATTGFWEPFVLVTLDWVAICQDDIIPATQKGL